MICLNYAMIPPFLTKIKKIYVNRVKFTVMLSFSWAAFSYFVSILLVTGRGFLCLQQLRKINVLTIADMGHFSLERQNFSSFG